MNKRFEALDAFRGICAIAVVVFHMHLVGSITELQFFRGSSIFVDFFFVLSGFVLAHGYAYKKNLKFTSFMRSRFFRIYPLHIFMFLVIFTLELGKLIAYKFGGFIFNNIPFTNSFAINEIIPNLLLIQSWSSYTDPLSFNYPSWSISIEFYMYALFFCSIIAFNNYKVIAWAITSIIAFSLIYSQSSLITSEVLRGVSCFFGGAFTYWLFLQTVTTFKLSVIVGTCLELLLLSMIIFAVQSQFNHRSSISSVLFMITVFFFAFEFGAISRLLRAKCFQLLGKLSYSIYMTHTAVLFCLTSIAIILHKVTGNAFTTMKDGIRFLDFGHTFTNNAVVIFIVMIVIAISNITYKYIELTGQRLNAKSNGSNDACKNYPELKNQKNDA
ncbi:acyltransferase [Shewanella sp. NKUCC05_KAH]|uniref:acyltransferase family protein n=1 Tax=Shewanella sp. NKUCC05_KAH TaxID=2842126 RepID=UPI001C5BED50|nr:acyltransferase [Shewanella sp. NKUCC05_KAH]MBW3528128.1 acyltransferase [Shewanella sp. NKUCC05_KAH]